MADIFIHDTYFDVSPVLLVGALLMLLAIASFYTWWRWRR
jgi:hypothetical protein